MNAPGTTSGSEGKGHFGARFGHSPCPPPAPHAPTPQSVNPRRLRGQELAAPRGWATTEGVGVARPPRGPLTGWTGLALVYLRQLVGESTSRWHPAVQMDASRPARSSPPASPAVVGLDADRTLPHPHP